ncbi:hypothetical protein BG004_002074, partial [Podila humilis]
WKTLNIDSIAKHDYFRDKIEKSQGNILSSCQCQIQYLHSCFGATWDLFVHPAAAIEAGVVSTALMSDVTAPPLPPYIPRASFSNLVALHAFAHPDNNNSGNADYVPQLFAVIEHSPRLRQLHVVDFCAPDKLYLSHLVQIIRAHGSLKELKLQVEAMHILMYWKVLWACWNLEKLKITTSIFREKSASSSSIDLEDPGDYRDEETLLDEWIAENRPDILAAATTALDNFNSCHNHSSFNDVLNNNKKKATTKMPFPLKELSLDFVGQDHDISVTAAFLVRCPWIERLALPRLESQSTMFEIELYIGYMLMLKHLDMSRLPRQAGWDALDALVLAACRTVECTDLILAAGEPLACCRQRGLKSLALPPRSSPMTMTMHVVRLQMSETLESLTLSACPSITSMDIQTVLCTCLHLRSFVGLCGMYDDEDARHDPILEGRDVSKTRWACRNLVTLRLRLQSGAMTEREDMSALAGLPLVISEQIMHLKQLKDLRLGLKSPSYRDAGLSPHSPTIHEWHDMVKLMGGKNLEKGLEMLSSSLTELELLELRGLAKYLNYDESQIKNLGKSFVNLRHMFLC